MPRSAAWIQSAAEVAYKNPNVYLDGSAFVIGNLDGVSRGELEEYATDPIAWIFGYVDDPTKLMFGSDWPLVSIPQYVNAFKKAIPEEVLETRVLLQRGDRVQRFQGLLHRDGHTMAPQYFQPNRRRRREAAPDRRSSAARTPP